MSAQLALNLRLRDDSSFDNFQPGGNRELVAQLRALAAAPAPSTRPLYLWGEAGIGKTHLLEAVCRHAHVAGERVAYVPLAESDALAPELLDDMDRLAVVCLDDVEHVAGREPWEQALFRLWERLRTTGGRLVAAAARSPATLGLRLPDLATRLAAGLVYQVKPLSDDDKLAALCARARARGLELGDDVARYILTRFPRNQGELFGMLERMDRAALINQRRLTIPFVRQFESGA
jgi:DnaA family protein